MKISSHLLLALASLTIFACQNEEPFERNIFTKDFKAPDSDWLVSKDSIIKEIDLSLSSLDFKLPVKMTMLTAMSADSCLKVAYLRLDRMDSDRTIKTSDFTTDHLECGAKFQSDDDRKFETLIVSGSIDMERGGETSGFSGTLLHIFSNGADSMLISGRSESILK